MERKDEPASWHGITGSEPDPLERVAAIGEALAPQVATGPRYEPPPHLEVCGWVAVVCSNTLRFPSDRRAR